MTIAGLVNALKTEAKHKKMEPPFDTRPVDEIDGYTFAVDSMLYIITFFRACPVGSKQWIGRLLDMHAFFTAAGVELIWLKEGTNDRIREYKQRAHNKRRSQQQKSKKNLEEYQLLHDFYTEDRESCLDLIREAEPDLTADEYEAVLDRMISSTAARIGALSKETSFPTDDDFKDAFTALIYAGATVIQTNSECEEVGSYLSRLGVFDGIITRDCDAIAYGAKIWISNFDVAKKTIETFDLEAAYEILGFDEMEPDEARDKLVTYCTLRGTDYSERIGNVKKIRALQFVKENKSIAGFSEEEKAALNLDWAKDHFEGEHFEEDAAEAPFYCMLPQTDGEELELLVERLRLKLSSLTYTTFSIRHPSIFDDAWSW